VTTERQEGTSREQGRELCDSAKRENRKNEKGSEKGRESETGTILFDEGKGRFLRVGK
jgi:hypothetical protein